LVLKISGLLDFSQWLLMLRVVVFDENIDIGAHHRFFRHCFFRLGQNFAFLFVRQIYCSLLLHLDLLLFLLLFLSFFLKFAIFKCLLLLLQAIFFLLQDFCCALPNFVPVKRRSPSIWHGLQPKRGRCTLGCGFVQFRRKLIHRVHFY